MRSRNCTWPSPARPCATLTRAGTRVIEVSRLWPGWNTSVAVTYVQGLVDVPFLNLTPGLGPGSFRTRATERFAALKPLETHLEGLIDEQQRAEEEQASQQSLKAIRKAFHEAMLALRARNMIGLMSKAAHAKRAPPQNPALAGSWTLLIWKVFCRGCRNRDHGFSATAVL